MDSRENISVSVFGKDGDILADPATQALLLASSALITGIMVVSPLIADLTAVYSVSSSKAGWLVIGFTAATAVSLPVVGVVVDQIQRKYVLVGGLLFFGVAGGAIGITKNFEVAIGLRVVQGIGFACTMPVILTAFGEMYRGSEEVTVQGMRVATNSVSIILVPLFAGVLFAYSWRFPFLLYLIAVPIAGWLWVTVPEFDKANDWTVRKYLDNIRLFLTDIQISLLMLSFALRFAIFYVFLTYISVLAIEEANLAVLVVGILLAFNGVVKAMGSTQAGRLSSSFGPIILSTGSLATMTVGITLMGLIPTPGAITVGVFIFSVGDSLLSPLQKSLVNRFSPAAIRGGANATALTFQNIGKVAGPLAFGMILPLSDPAQAFAIAGGLGGILGTVTMMGVWMLSD